MKHDTCPNCDRSLATGIHGHLVCYQTPAASLVGDSSEAPREPFDRVFIRRSMALAITSDELANNVMALLGCYDALESSLRSMSVALDAARQDTARLDWLDDQTHLFDMVASQYAATVGARVDIVFGISLREAIDAARPPASEDATP